MATTVKQAREIARQYVERESGSIPGFMGAFLHGSITVMLDDALLPSSSDVDVMIVLKDAEPPVKLGKFLYEDVLLEISYLSADQVESPQQVLGNYQLAGSFISLTILVDPTGQLSRVHQFVAENFAKRSWVQRRCEDARAKALRDLQYSDPEGDLAEQVLSWVFGVGKIAHILLVAGLMNPTVRKRYVAVEELLLKYQAVVVYEALLEVAGLTGVSRVQVEGHLSALADVFDATCPLVKSAFPFASDISPVARPIAIDGSYTLIEQGFHREAMFWIVVTYSRCMVILNQDAMPETVERFRPAYHRLLADLGVRSVEDVAQYKRRALDFLPVVEEVADHIIMANNPDIVD